MKNVRTLSIATALRADRISRKSASIPASAIRNISPSEPSESTNVLNCCAVFAAVCASSPGVPRKLSHLESTATRSNPSSPFDPMSMPTTSSAITFGIWYLRSRNGNIAMSAVSAMKRIRKEESFMVFRRFGWFRLRKGWYGFRAIPYYIIV